MKSLLLILSVLALSAVACKPGASESDAPDVGSDVSLPEDATAVDAPAAVTPAEDTTAVAG